MTRPPRDPRPRPPAPADDEDVTRVGARAVGSGEDAADLRGRDEDVTRVGAFAVAPDDAVARSHLDAELGFEPLEEPVTQLGAAVTLSGDEDDAVVAPPIPGAAYLKARDAENAPGAPPDAPLVRPSPRSGLRSVDRGSQPYASPPHASPPAEPARPLVRGRGLTRRPGGRAAVVAVEPDPPDRRAAPAVSVPHQAPVAPTRGSRESATLGQAALAGALEARDPDDAMATRVSVARRATDPIGGGAVPDRADRVGRPPRDATAPDLSPVHVDGAPRESTDPTGRPVFMDREPTDPEGQPAIVVGTWERESFETPDLLGPPSNRTKRTQTAPHGAARVAGSGIVDASSPPQVSPTGLPASEPAETQRGVPPMRPPRAAAASLSIPGGRVPLAPPVAASEPPQAAAGPDGPVSLAGSRGVPFAPRGVTTEVPIEHRIPRSLAEAPGPRGLDRTGRVGEAGSVALRTSAVASASGLSSASGVSGPAASTVTALGVPDRSARSGLRGWSVLAMLLLFEAVALPTAAGPPWQHISDPGSVTFVALAFLLLTAVAHIVPARPVVRAGLAVAVGSLMLVFGLSLGRDAVAADLFDGQPGMERQVPLIA